MSGERSESIQHVKSTATKVQNLLIKCAVHGAQQTTYFRTEIGTLVEFPCRCSGAVAGVNYVREMVPVFWRHLLGLQWC